MSENQILLASDFGTNDLIILIYSVDKNTFHITQSDIVHAIDKHFQITLNLNRIYIYNFGGDLDLLFTDHPTIHLAQNKMIMVASKPP